MEFCPKTNPFCVFWLVLSQLSCGMEIVVLCFRKGANLDEAVAFVRDPFCDHALGLVVGGGGFVEGGLVCIVFHA